MTISTDMINRLKVSFDFGDLSNKNQLSMFI